MGVFVDTSLGTHIAISVSPNLTVSQFKRIFPSMHSTCYPEMGNIQVIGIMVKRKSNLYHLPESMPIKHAFQASKKTWFLHINATLSQNISNNSLLQVQVEPTSETSISLSVSGIIKKYFFVCDADDEVTSNNSKHRLLNYAPKTPSPSRDLKKSSGVGKRVILAANTLGVSASHKKPTISLCKFKCKNLSVPVFELAEK